MYDCQLEEGIALDVPIASDLQPRAIGKLEDSAHPGDIVLSPVGEMVSQ